LDVVFGKRKVASQSGAGVGEGGDDPVLLIIFCRDVPEPARWRWSMKVMPVILSFPPPTPDELLEEVARGGGTETLSWLVGAWPWSTPKTNTTAYANTRGPDSRRPHRVTRHFAPLP
jgi:hypothetical protein